jgi:hypothetical protein
MALKTATQNKPIEQPRRWPFDYSTEEIKNNIGDFELTYQDHATCATGVLVHNEILGFTPQGIIDWLVEENIIMEKDGAWFVCYYSYQSWSSKYRGMREIQSRRAFAKRMELRQLDDTKEKVVAAVSAPAKSEEDLEWEIANGIKISEIPF